MTKKEVKEAVIDIDANIETAKEMATLPGHTKESAGKWLHAQTTDHRSGVAHFDSVEDAIGAL